MVVVVHSDFSPTTTREKNKPKEQQEILSFLLKGLSLMKEILHKNRNPPKET
jgi:hypothetical protein